jgi:cell division protein FtsL
MLRFPATPWQEAPGSGPWKNWPLKNHVLNQLRLFCMKKTAQNKIGQRKLTGIWLLVMCIFFAELLAYTWSRVQCTRIGYEISKATIRNQSLTTDQDNLAIELARLKSPQRIEKIATQEMNLKTPSLEQVIVIP